MEIYFNRIYKMPKIYSRNWLLVSPCGIERSFQSKEQRLQFLKIHKKVCDICKESEIDCYKNVINSKYDDLQHTTIEQRTKILDFATTK